MVVNVKCTPCDQFIGRPTIYGNPFIIGKDGNREEVIAKYKDYFNKKIIEDESFKKAVLSLRGKVLGCFCKPEKCHGDIIERYIESTYEN